MGVLHLLREVSDGRVLLVTLQLVLAAFPGQVSLHEFKSKLQLEHACILHLLSGQFKYRGASSMHVN